MLKKSKTNCKVNKINDLVANTDVWFYHLFTFDDYAHVFHRIVNCETTLK